MTVFGEQTTNSRLSDVGAPRHHRSCVEKIAVCVPRALGLRPPTPHYFEPGCCDMPQAPADTLASMMGTQMSKKNSKCFFVYMIFSSWNINRNVSKVQTKIKLDFNLFE